MTAIVPCFLSHRWAIVEVAGVSNIIVTVNDLTCLQINSAFEFGRIKVVKRAGLLPFRLFFPRSLSLLSKLVNFHDYSDEAACSRLSRALNARDKLFRLFWSFGAPAQPIKAML